MKKKFLLLAFASVFLLSAVIASQLIVTVAALRNVGVSEGDWALYDWAFSTNMTMPPPLEEIDSIKITVLEISGTNITYQWITHYVNDTEETEIYVLDVDTGQGNGTYAFIAKNLNPGDLIYTSPPPDGPIPQGATINETISLEYLGGSVEVNHWNLNMSETIPGLVTLTKSTNLYWYRATGMMAEMSFYMLVEPDVGNATWSKYEAVIIDIIPEFPPALILPIFIITTLTAVWLGKKIWPTKKLTKKPSPCP